MRRSMDLMDKDLKRWLKRFLVEGVIVSCFRRELGVRCEKRREEM